MSNELHNVTAAILVIGDEILTGRTKDKNIGTIADYLFELGIDLSEVRVVPDIEAEIIAAVNALRHRYDYVFTTGGIGPTHDDITADAIAKAFNVALPENPRALALLQERIKPEHLNAARRRMARIPEGAELVDNSLTKAPGFMIENVIVMAGVPSIMQVMLEAVTPKLRHGQKMQVETLTADAIPEGAYASALSDIALAHPMLSIGSYPSMVDGVFHNQIIVRGRNRQAVEKASAQIRSMIATITEARRQNP